MPNKKFLTIHEAADILKVSTKTLRRWESAGRLIPSRTDGGHRRYSLTQIESFKRSQKKTSPKPIERTKIKPNIASSMPNQAFGQTSTKPQISFPGDKLNQIQPVYFEPLHFDQKKTLKRAAFVAFMVVLLAIANSSGALSKFRGILGTKNQDTAEKARTENVLATRDSLLTTTLNVNIEANFESDADIAGNLNLSGNRISSSDDMVVSPGGGGVSIGTATPANVDLAGGDLFVSGDFEAAGGVFAENATITGSLTLNDEAITDLTGSGITIVDGALTSSLGTSISSAEIEDGSIAEVDLNASNTPSNGQVLTFNSSTGAFTWANDATGESSPWTLTSSVVHLDTSTDNVSLGTTSNLAKLGIVGDTDEVQLLVRGNSTQTSNNLVVFEDSSGNDLLSLSGAGVLTIPGLNCSGNANGGALTANSSGVISCSDDDGGGSAVGWTDDGTVVRLDSSTDNVSIGTTSNLAKLAVDGDTDEIQFLVQGNSTQTSNLVVFENSGGTDLLTLNNSGNLTLAGDLTVTGNDIAGSGGTVISFSGVNTSLAGNLTTTGDITVNGGDITSTAALTITPGAGTNLNISLSTTGDFAVNTNQLYVDTSAGSVGIGTSSPASGMELHVAGDLQLGLNGTDGTLTLYNELGATDYSVVFQTSSSQTQTTTYTLPPDDGNANYVLTTDGSGVLTWSSVAGVGGMNSFTLSGDSGTDQTIDDADTLEVAGGSGITTTAGATDTITLAFASTELNDLTWGTGGASTITWSTSLLGATDPTLTFGNNQVTIGNAATLTATSVTTFNCTDCIDFDDLDDTLDLDANLTLNQSTNTWTQSFTGTTTTGLTYNANSLTTGSALNITTSSNPASAGPVSPISFNLTNANATTATTINGVDIGFTNNPTVAGNTEYVLQIQNEATSNTTDNALAALLRLDNADTSTSGSTVVTDAILVSVSGGLASGIVDAIDASDANIDNALNIGANNIVGTTGNIDLINFDVVGSTGNITTAGDIAVNGGDITSTAATLIINAGGNVDIQDALNADSITTDTGGVSIAAGQSYTGTGAVTLSSGGASGLTIDSASGSVTFATDDDLIPTLGAADADIGSTSARWDNIYASAGNFSGTVTAGDISCTDCLDFAEFANSMSVDEATDINLGANTLTIDLDSTGDFSIRDVTTDIATFADSGAITFTPTTGQSLTVSNTAPTADLLIVSGGTSTTSGVDALQLTFGTSNASGNVIDITPSFAGGATDALTYNVLDIDAFSPTNAAGTDNVRGINIGNLTDPGATITSVALNIGSGWDSVLRVGGTEVINGSGQVVTTQLTGTLFTAASDTSSSTIIQGDTLTLAGGTNGIDTTNTGDSFTINFDSTEVGSVTWNAGSSDPSWTFNTSGATDPTLAFANSSLTIGSAATIATDQTTLTLFNTTATTINFAGGATTALNIGSTTTGVNTFNADVDLAFSGGENLTLTNTSASTDQLSLAVSGVTTDGVDAISIAFTQADDTDATDTNSALRVALTSSSGDADTLYGLNFADFTSGTATETAIRLGAGFNNLFEIEGNSGDGFQTFIVATAPSADRTITIPDDSGTICLSSGNCAGGAGGSKWTDSGTTVYLTDTTDELVVGGTSPLSSAKISIDGDADQIQLLVQGNSTQTSSLAVFENSAGTDVLTISNSGALAIAPTTTGTHLDFQLETEWTGGTLINADYATATTQASDIIGTLLDFNTNLTGAADSDVTGVRVNTPTLTSSGTATTTYTGFSLPTAGALTQNTAAGTINWYGVNITMPNITQTTGTVTADGIRIANGTITTGGTQRLLNLAAAGVGAGTLYGADFGNITAGAGTETAVRIGSGYDNLFEFEGATDNGFETFIAVADPTADQTITFPNDTGTVCLSSGNCAGGAGGSKWTDAGTFTYLTSTTDSVTIGSSTLELGKLGIVGDADEIQLIVRGNSTQTSNLVVFENSAGTDQFILTNTGNLTLAGDLTISGGDITGANSAAIDIGEATSGAITFVAGSAGDFVFTVDSDTDIRTTGGADGTDVLVIPAGDILLSDGDLDLSGGDFNVTLDAADGVNIAKGAAPTVDVFSIDGGTSATDGVDGLQLTFGVSAASGNVIDITPSYTDATAGSTSENYFIIDIDAFTATQNAAGDTGQIRGLNIGNLTQTETAGTITASALRIGTGWDDILNYNGTTVINGSGQVVTTQLTGTLFTAASDTSSSTIIQGDTLTLAGGTNGIDTTNTGDSFTINFDSTEVGTTTWGSGSGITWTFDAGATDPTITFASDAITFTAADNTFTGNVNANGGLDVDDVFIVADGGAVTANTDVDLTFAASENLTLTNTSASTDQFSLTASTITNGVDALSITFTQNDDGDAFDINSALAITLTSSSGDTDTLYGINIANLTGGTATEIGLSIGSGWDTDLAFADSSVVIDGPAASSLTLQDFTTLTASSVTAFNCTDCIDFDDLEDTLDLDANLTLNQSTNTWSQSFTGTTTTGFSYTAASLTTGQALSLSATNTPTTDAAINPILIALTNAQSTVANTNSYTGQLISYTHNPASGIATANESVQVIRLAQNDTAAGDTTVASLLRLENLDTATGNSQTVTDAILVSATTADLIVDAIDVSDPEITNGINLGNNNLILAGDTINDFTGNGALVVSGNALILDATVSGDALSSTTSAGSGLEVLSTGLTLLQGCSDGQVLKWNETTDTWDCSADNSGSATPGGSDTQIQYNNAGAFGGTSSFTFNNTTLELTATDDFTFTLGGTENIDITNTTQGAADLVSIASTWTTDTSADALSITTTYNVSASTSTVYGLNLTNADNGANTGVIDALALFSNNQATETLADGVIIRHNAASGTLTDALQIENTTAGGTITNAINIIETAGTITTGINIGSGVGTAIVLQNGESIDNSTNNQINLNLGAAGSLLLTSSTSSTITNSAGSIILDSTGGTIDINDATIDIATQATDLEIIDNTAAAFTISQGANSYLDISTTDTTTSLTLDLPVAGSTSTTGNLFTSNVAKTINIGTGTAADIINIGTGGTTADTITFGNTGVATTFTFNSGATTTTPLTFNLNSVTTATAVDLSLDGLTTGTGLLIDDGTAAGLSTGTLLHINSVSTALAATADSGDGILANFDWNPASSTTGTGDLFRIRLDANGTLTSGSIFNIVDETTSVFNVKETAITSALPHSFTAAGDVSIAYDLVFTNQTASTIKASGPLTIEQGESSESNNLTLRTYNSGQVLIDGTLNGTTVVSNTTSTAAGTVTVSGRGVSYYLHDDSGTTNSSYTTTINVTGVPSVAGSIVFIRSGCQKGATTDSQTHTCAIQINGTQISSVATATGTGASTVIENYVAVYLNGSWRLIVGSNTSSDTADLAEVYKAEVDVDAAEVVALLSNDELKVRRAVNGDSGLVIGVTSTKPAVLIGDEFGDQIRRIAVALSGRVPVKVSPNSSAIKIGDLIGPSSEPGKARRVSGGFIVGRALESWTPGSGKETVTIFVNPIYVNETQFAQTNYEGRISNLENSLALLQAQLGFGQESTNSANFTDLTVSNINILGDAVLGDTVINGKLNVGALTFDNVEQSINAIGVLKIQDLALGNIEFLGGLITFDTDGNITAKEVTAEKYNVAGDSAGTGTLPSGETEIFIQTTAVTHNSLIFVTPKFALDYPLAVIEKQEGIGFKVQVAVSENQDVEFDWWVVDKISSN